MTRHETLQCVHEPFGDAYYFGPERLAERYENDPKARKESGYEDSTYRTIFDRIAKENSEVRLLISSYIAGCPILSLLSYFQININVLDLSPLALNTTCLSVRCSPLVNSTRPIHQPSTSYHGYVAQDTSFAIRYEQFCRKISTHVHKSL